MRSSPRPSALRCAGSGSARFRAVRNRAFRPYRGFTGITRPVGFLIPAGPGQPRAPGGGKFTLGVIQRVRVAGGPHPFHDRTGDGPAPAVPFRQLLFEDAPDQPLRADADNIVILTLPA